jgi:hypothetical protein
MIMDQAVRAESIVWPLNGVAVMSASYAQEDERFDRIYSKSKQQQWNVDDYDWTYELDADNPLKLPDQTLLIYGSSLWDRLSDERRSEARRHFQSWTLSQILHGEQGALMCAAKLAQGESSNSARMCAAVQVFDEARHVEAYSRLVNDKMRLCYPLSSSLASLLEDTVTSPDLDITNLGMQILVEGIALSIFHSLVVYSQDSFIKKLVTQIQRDEARHFAVGQITLTDLYTNELTSHELMIREEFLCEGISVLYEHLCADDIWEPLGHNRKECAGLVRESLIAATLRRNLFRRLVPAVKSMGLLRGRVVQVLESLSLLDYADWPMRDIEQQMSAA